jgi:hypothetical protein
VKLTYNANDNTVVVEGTSDEVNAWYRVFVHSQTACQDTTQTIVLPDITPVNQEQKQLLESLFTVNAVPDEDGWIDWTPKDDNSVPDGLSEDDVVEYFVRNGSYLHKRRFGDLIWGKVYHQITKYRVVK